VLRALQLTGGKQDCRFQPVNGCLHSFQVGAKFVPSFDQRDDYHLQASGSHTLYAGLLIYPAHRLRCSTSLATVAMMRKQRNKLSDGVMTRRWHTPAPPPYTCIYQQINSEGRFDRSIILHTVMSVVYIFSCLQAVPKTH
jgi:hypothetical protein